MIMPRESPSTSLPLKGLRILVVEDEMMISMLLEELLGEQGCEIVGPAARLAKAIDLASTQRIDAALWISISMGRTYIRSLKSFPVAAFPSPL